MTCQECELLIAADQNADEHLAECASCRALLEELRANAVAFESFAGDPLPSVRGRVMSKIRPRRWIWALAAAAAIVIAMLIPTHRRPVSAPVVSVAGGAPAVTPEAVAKIQSPARKGGGTPRRSARRPTLTVKMLTPDPDVVIYWQFESEEEK